MGRSMAIDDWDQDMGGHGQGGCVREHRQVP